MIVLILLGNSIDGVPDATTWIDCNIVCNDLLGSRNISPGVFSFSYHVWYIK